MQYLIQFPQKMLPLDQAGHHFSVAGVIFHFFFYLTGGGVGTVAHPRIGPVPDRWIMLSAGELLML